MENLVCSSCLRWHLASLVSRLAPATVVAFLTHLLIFFGELLQLVIREMFDIDHFIVRLIDGLDDFIEFEVNGAGVAVLRVLNQKHHQESDDRGAGIDNKLPRIGVVEVWPGHNPQCDYEQGGEERPFRSHPIGCLRGEDVKTFFSVGPVCAHAATIEGLTVRLQPGRCNVINRERTGVQRQSDLSIDRRVDVVRVFTAPLFSIVEGSFRCAHLA